MPFSGLDHYDQYRSAFYQDEDLSLIDRDGTFLSESIYYSLSRIRLADWKLRESFHRFMKSETSSVFQNLIAYYLRSIFREPEFRVDLEKMYRLAERYQGIRPDITISFSAPERVLFAIEVKTTIGWQARNFGEDCNKRIEELKKALSIESEQVAFIIETPRNGRRDFINRFVQNGRPVTPTEFPYTNMLPLFMGPADPMAIRHLRMLGSNKISDEQLKLNDNMIHTRLEVLISMIDNAIERAKNS